MAGRRHWFYVFDMVARKVTRINEIKGCSIMTHPPVPCICLFILLFSVMHFSLGHEKRYFCDFQVSPDNQLLAFLGKDGYIPLLSNKVCTLCYLINDVSPVGH